MGIQTGQKGSHKGNAICLFIQHYTMYIYFSRKKEVYMLIGKIHNIKSKW